MAQKQLTFIFRPDNDNGMKVGITFVDAGGSNPKFVVGDGPQPNQFLAQIQDNLPGGATVTTTESELTFENFPIVPNGGGGIASGSPVLKVSILVQANANSVTFAVANKQAAIPGFIPTIQIENDNCAAGATTNPFSLI